MHEALTEGAGAGTEGEQTPVECLALPGVCSNLAPGKP